MTDTAAAALVAVLGDLKELPTTKEAKVPMKEGGSYSYKYAGLDDVLRYVRPLLKQHGLAVAQDVTGIPGQDVAVATRFYHESGEVITFGPLTLKASANAQQTGSAITYARRYALMAALGLATEDDDGGLARDIGEARQEPRQESYRTRDEAAIRSILSGLEPDHRKQLQREFRERYGAGLSDLDESEHGAARVWVEDRTRDYTPVAAEEERPCSPAQRKRIFGLLSKIDDAGEPHAYVTQLLELPQPLESFNDLTEAQAESAIRRLQDITERQ